MQNAYESLLNPLESLVAFVSIVHGRGPECTIPETVVSPLGVPIKLGDIMRDANSAIAEVKGAPV